MVSGIILSQTVFSFLKIHGGSLLARNIHMVCAYGGYILMSMGIVKKHFQKKQKKFVWGLRLAAFLFADYGAFAFDKRDIGNYMLLKYHFVFFDFAEPLIFFLLDYIAVMVLFVFIGHYFAMFLKWCGHKKRRRSDDLSKPYKR